MTSKKFTRLSILTKTDIGRGGFTPAPFLLTAASRGGRFFCKLSPLRYQNVRVDT